MAGGKLCFDDFQVVGFDLDHTLCKYKLDNLFPHIYDSIVTVLVEKFGYDKDLLFPFNEGRDFCFKGLVLDTRKGNVLKFSEDGTIARASHGSTPLSYEEIEDHYPGGKYPYFETIKETLSQSVDCRYFENYFDMPLLLISTRIVDHIDKKAGNRLKEYDFFKDVLAAAGMTWKRESFREDAYYFFPALKKDPAKYIQKCSPKVCDWLKSLKDSGKVIFMLTSSHVDFASFLAEYILGPEWRSYFNICITYARKPGFFTNEPKDRPFYSLYGAKEGPVVEVLHSNNTYSQGNVHTFHKYLEEVTGLEKPKILYCGDSIRSDIFPVVKFGHWTSVLILEEMEAEGMIEDDKHPRPKMPKLEGPSSTEKEYLTSKQWGSFFTDDVREGRPDRASHSAPPPMNTLWGYLIRNYASIAAPQLDYIAELPMKHKFATFDSDTSGTAGFFPSPPLAFRE